MGNSYLYRHIRKDTNKVFYVGVGTGRNYERANTTCGRNNIWRKIVSKTEYEVEVMLDDLDRDFALEREKEFIQLYGRIDIGTGTLCNLTEGGDGCFGFSDEVKKKMSDAQKGNQKWKLRKSHDYAVELGKANKGRVVSEEMKRHLSEMMSGENGPFYGRTHTDKVKEKLRKIRSKPVSQYTLDGEFIRSYDSAKQTRQFGFEPSSVNKCCTGRHKTHKKYIWKFLNNN